MLELTDLQVLATERKRLFGVYPAVVTNIKDEDGQGRIKIRLPWTPDDDAGYEVWARLVTFMAGKDRGAWFIPDPEDEVLVAFEAGDPRRPYVVGALWNGKDAPPETMDGAGDNNKKSLVSRRNLRVTLDDTEGQETITIKTPGGQVVTIQDGPDLVELRDTTGHVIKLEQGGITISGGAKVTVQATEVEIGAGSLKVNCPQSTFSGAIKANAIDTETITSKTYSPGAGNMW
jgi:uncharacterized protein involved in type VI secretion and phage assembly